MHYIRYGNSVFEIFYSICRQTVLQVVAYKDPICCLLEQWKATKTSLELCYTSGGLCTNLGELT